jgi:aldose 1-epimerase
MRPRLSVSLVSSALDEPTPIMLSTHIYWTLNAFKEKTVLNNTYLYMPYSDRWIETDGILIPTGEIGTVATTPALDFTSPKTIGAAVDDAQGLCGTNCTGVDNAFIIDRPQFTPVEANTKVLSMWSDTTGIQLDVTTNQQGLQVYTCNGQNGTIPVKQSQQDRNNGSSDAAQYVEKYGCVVIEPQAWIDGINHPEWGVDRYEIFSPTTGPSVWWAEYDFSTF